MKIFNNTKLKLICFTFFTAFFILGTIDAQDINLKVKKGTVTLNSNKLTLSSPPFQMKTSDKVIVPAEAVLVGTISGSFVQVPSGKSYTYQDIKKLGKSSASKASVGNEVFFGTMQKTFNNY